VRRTRSETRSGVSATRPLHPPRPATRHHFGNPLGGRHHEGRHRPRGRPDRNRTHPSPAAGTRPQGSQRQLNRAGADLTTPRQGYARAADSYRELNAQASQVWTDDELTAASANATSDGRFVSPSRTATLAPMGRSRLHSGLWITVWQARYPCGDVVGFPSPAAACRPPTYLSRVPRIGVASPYPGRRPPTY
jgi:hypothetical protein